jgi:hypothetical protein
MLADLVCTSSLISLEMRHGWLLGRIPRFTHAGLVGERGVLRMLQDRRFGPTEKCFYDECKVRALCSVCEVVVNQLRD